MKTLFLLVFTIAFTCYSNKGYSQLISTQVKINVKNNLGKDEEGVRVRLFTNEADYKSEKNIVQEHYTDKKGHVTFKDLQPIKYYVAAVKDNRSNAGNGEVTEPLKEKSFNKMMIIITE